MQRGIARVASPEALPHGSGIARKSGQKKQRQDNELRNIPLSVLDSGSLPTLRETFVVSSPAAVVARDDRRTPQEHSTPSLPPDQEAEDEEQAEVQPPNGGLQAYLKVLGCFFVNFITLGLASAFGSYQAYYEETLLQTYSSSAISWIGTIQVFLLSFLGTLSGAFYDRGYVREVLIAGLTLVVLGMCLLSLAREYWQIVLTQGVCVGAGRACVFNGTPGY